MPLYDYACSGCGKVTEIRHGFNETHDQPCSECGAPLKRVFSAAPIVFKGSGFYLTDSRKGGSSDSKPAESKPAESTPKASSEPAA